MSGFFFHLNTFWKLVWFFVLHLLHSSYRTRYPPCAQNRFVTSRYLISGDYSLCSCRFSWKLPHISPNPGLLGCLPGTPLSSQSPGTTACLWPRFANALTLVNSLPFVKAHYGVPRLPPTCYLPLLILRGSWKDGAYPRWHWMRGGGAAQINHQRSENGPQLNSALKAQSTCKCLQSPRKRSEKALYGAELTTTTSGEYQLMIADLLLCFFPCQTVWLFLCDQSSFLWDGESLKPCGM